MSSEITFKSLEEFEDAVMKVVKNRLRIDTDIHLFGVRGWNGRTIAITLSDPKSQGAKTCFARTNYFDYNK